VPSEVKFGIISLYIALSSYQLGKPRRRLEDKIVTDNMGLISGWNGCGPSTHCHVIECGFFLVTNCDIFSLSATESVDVCNLVLLQLTSFQMTTSYRPNSDSS